MATQKELLEEKRKKEAEAKKSGFDMSKMSVEDLQNNPDIMEFLNDLADRKAQEAVERQNTLQMVNRCEFYGRIKDKYVFEGKPKMKEEDGKKVPVVDVDGNIQRYADRFYITISNENFGDKQIQVDDQRLFEHLIMQEGETFIFEAILETNTFDNRALAPIIIGALHTSTYQLKDTNDFRLRVKKEDLPDIAK